MSLKNTNFIKEPVKECRATQSGATPAWEGPTQSQAAKNFLACILGVGILVLGVFIMFTLPAGSETGGGGATSQQNSRQSSATEEHATASGDFVASVNSDVFHWISCDYAANINKENRVYFKTTTEARQSGRRECSVCFFGTQHAPISISNGEIVTYPWDDGLAPLTVTTKGEENYYVTLKGTDQMSFYVKGGHTAEVDVPLGEYEIYYATGGTWYGKRYKFGPDTNYYKCDGFFDFYQDGDYCNGWTLELYKQAGGNMSTEAIDALDFPDI